MGNWQRRLAALERAHLDQMICEVAAEFGLTPADLWDELEQIEQHYETYGTYPADIQQLHVFHARHGRWPQTEAEFDACLCVRLATDGDATGRLGNGVQFVPAVKANAEFAKALYARMRDPMEMWSPHGWGDEP